MFYCRHRPSGLLGEHVEYLWYFEGLMPAHRVEHVVPDGSFELIIDLREPPRRLFDREDPAKHQSFRRAWISGAHSEYIVIDVLPDSSMIGAHFKPGGAAPFLGTPADELADRVVEAEQLWSREIVDLRDGILEAKAASAKFTLLEQFLLRRWSASRVKGTERATVRHAVSRLGSPGGVPAVRDLADDLGVSHKHLVEEFRRAVGLTPKLFHRIRRFQDVLAAVQASRSVEWADVAARCGYYDQAHFIRDFKAFSGLNPTRFLRQTEGDSRFIPVNVGGR